MSDTDRAPGKTEALERTASGAAIETLVTYLEMTAPPEQPATLPPGPAVEIRRAVRPTTSFYRYLYDAVGGPWTWTERRLMSDTELAAIVRDARVEVLVLWVDGVPAGYAELDRRAPPDIELAYFGLVPEFIGQGLGRFLLDLAVRRAWSCGPRRVWVHTCDLDHPNALGVYQKCGFRVYDRRMGRVSLST
jgi:GNAT superfamily N-acetyltransferase